VRCGRKRKFGPREANGRLQRIKDAERRGRLGERFQVANQPHRLGVDDPLLESPLGRFVLRHKLHRAAFDAGLAFGTLSHRYLSAKARGTDIREAPSGSGADISEEKAKWLAAEVARIERPLREMSPVGFAAVSMMAVYEREPPPRSETEAIGVLFGLARMLGVLR
jgi:hypothetical protein